MRNHKNQTNHLINGEGKFVSNEEELRDAAPGFYEKLFNTDTNWTTFPPLTVKRKLSPEVAVWLIRPVSVSEVKLAVFQFNPNKVPGSDEYNAHFFQKYWSVVREDVTAAVQSFFQNGSLLKEVNHTLLTLIPKCHNASSLCEYRPISCCQLLYKFISRILSNGLKQVVGGLTSDNQNAFLSGRSINDCTLLAHELVRDFKKKTISKICLKVDLQKAFDSINRSFVYFVMDCVGFPAKWITWIKECINSPTFSIMMNGNPNDFFQK